MPMREEHGYTLIELIATLSIMLIAGGLIYAVYLDALRHVHRWQNRMALENQGHLIVNRLTLDLHEGMELERPSESLWIIRKSDDAHVTYELDGQKLYRDGHLMLDSSLYLSRFEILPRQKKNDASAGANFQETVALRVVIRTETDSLKLTTKIHLRAPKRWDPLHDRTIP